MLVSGCHRKPSGLTPIPGIDGPAGSGQNSQNQETPRGIPVTPEPPVTASDAPRPEMGYGKYSDLFAGPHNEDREIFKNDTVYFDFDRATVKTSEEGKLQDVYNHFKSSTGDALIVEGNCDERGTEKYNLSLGERRALAIREYLANLGMDPQRIKTVTFGASKPVETGHNEAAWKKNRRGDLVLVTPK